MFNESNLLIYKVYEILKNKGIQIDDPKKLSHSSPEKTLIEHVEECYEYARKLYEEIFNTKNDEYLKFLYVICQLHDLGKLSPDWDIKRGGKHSLYSIKYLENALENNNFIKSLLSNDLWNLIKYFIKHHHTVLKYPRAINEERKISWIIEKQEKAKAIDYADLFGIFKISDYLSASNLGEILFTKKVHRLNNGINEELVINKLVTRKLDNKKLEIQRNLAFITKDHLFLTAPTGWGKTIIGFLRLNVVKPYKVFYVLPTITAIRKMIDNIQSLFGKEKVGEYFYFADVDVLLEKNYKDDEKEYILDFYKYFIPAINFTTIDQLLITLLKAGKYHMRRFMFRNSLIIIDEYHLLTPQMIGALRALIEFYKNVYDMKFLFMTATPQILYRKYLLESLGESNTEIFELYKLFKNYKRHLIEFYKDLTIEKLLNQRSETIANYDKILVIVNTVEKAINTYELLKEIAKDRSVTLLHARYAVKDRYSKEREIEDTDILVATQVAEVSLDVNFNLLITEIAPLPSLIQRMGRVNRYGLHKPDKPNVLIVGGVDTLRPYDLLGIKYTKDILINDIKEVNNKGDYIYLDLVKKYEEKFEKDFRENLEYYYKKTINILDMNPLSSLEDDEFSIIESLRRESAEELTVLAIPHIYENEYIKLYHKLKKASSYYERLKLLAHMKSLMVPVPLYLIKQEKQVLREELPIPLVGGEDSYYKYNPEIGLHKVS